MTTLALRAIIVPALSIWVLAVPAQQPDAPKAEVSGQRLDSIMNVSHDLRAAGNNKEAYDLLVKAEALARSLGSHERWMDARIGMAATSVDQGLIAQARRILERTLAELDPADPGYRKDVARVEADLGLGYHHEGEFTKALEHYLTALRGFEALSDTAGQLRMHNNIGFLHMDLKDHEQALISYDHALGLMSGPDDPMLPDILAGKGIVLLENGDLDQSMAIFEESRARSAALGADNSVAESMQMMGVVHLKRGEFAEALSLFQQAERTTQLARSVIQARMNQATAMIEMGERREAVDLSERTLALAEEQGALSELSQLHLSLSQELEKLGDKGNALRHFKQHITFRDSIYNVDKARESTRMAMQYAFDKEQLADSLANAVEKERIQLENEAHVAREKNRRNAFLFSGIGLLVVAGGLWSRLRETRRSRAAIQKEKDRSDELLLNILPEEVANELKETGAAQAKHFDQATILFTDFKGFTQLSEKVTPAQLVEELNSCFKEFDALMGKYRIEKIKTIGDAYMAAGGLPDPQHGSANDVVKAALEMQAFMARYKAELEAAGKPFFEMRVGIHTGPVVAGIVGVKKFAYDIWGDTVNTASRMESSGEVGQVNISEATYSLVKDEPGLAFTPRGKVQAKGKGELEMYFVARSHHES